METLDERIKVTNENLKALDKKLGEIQKKRKKAQAELESYRLREREIADKIEEDAAELHMDPILVNNKEMKIEVEPCQHYQWNICLDGISNEISKYLKNILAANNIVFEGSLRVHMDIPSLNLTAHKFFSLTYNYSKGKGDQFKSYIEKNHSRAPLVYIVNRKGS